MSFLFKYLRHSDEVAKQPHSKQSQLNQINLFLQYAVTTDQQLASCQDAGEFWDADVSGGKYFHKRPAGGVIMGRIQKGDVIIAAAWDRMFRVALDGLQTLQRLDEIGARLICLDFKVDTSTAMGKFAATVLVGKGELERNQTSERIKDRLDVLKYNRGVNVAYGRPIGWKRVRDHQEKKKNGQEYCRLVPDQDERYRCMRIVTLIDAKGMNFTQAARHCNLNNVGNRKWNGQSIKSHYIAAKAKFPCKDFDNVTGQNSELLMVPVEVPSPAQP